MRPIPNLENYKGLIFGSFDPKTWPFEEYLGDMALYLDLLVDRENGTEVFGGVQKWRVQIELEDPGGELRLRWHASYIHPYLGRDGIGS